MLKQIICFDKDVYKINDSSSMDNDITLIYFYHSNPIMIMLVLINNLIDINIIVIYQLLIRVKLMMDQKRKRIKHPIQSTCSNGFRVSKVLK